MKTIYLISLFIILFSNIIFSQNIFTVTNTNDPDPFLYDENPDNPEIIGTLQWAIRKANETGDATINFDIPANGLQEIVLNYDLPRLMKTNITIDASTQAGYQLGIPVINISGNNNLYYGIQWGRLNNITINGISFSNFKASAISMGNTNYCNVTNCVFSKINSNTDKIASSAINIISSSYCNIFGNYIGTNHLLEWNTNIQDYGIFISCTDPFYSRYNNIGNSDGFKANTIANCGKAGIYLTNPNTKYNKISANRIFNNPRAISLINGANENKQAPVILNYTENGTVSGTAEPGDIVEIFGSNGNENANEYLGTTTADNGGNWSVSNIENNFNNIVSASISESFNTSTISAKVEKIIWNPDDCSEPCNFIHNGNFETIVPYYNSDSPFLNDHVCMWKAMGWAYYNSSHPVILPFQNVNADNYCYMSASSGGNLGGRGIVQEVNLIENNSYKLEFDYKIINSSHGCNDGKLQFLMSNYILTNDEVSPINIENIYTIIEEITTPTGVWEHHTSIINVSNFNKYFTVYVQNGQCNCVVYVSIDNIKITPNNTLNVQISENPICKGSETSIFSNYPGDEPITYTWSSSNQNYFTQNIIVSPINNTTYTVTVTDANGCTANDQVTVIVDKSIPEVSFYFDNLDNCVNNQVLFTNTSEYNSAISYQWDFDGNGSFDMNSYHGLNTYSYPGYYNVILYGINTCGSASVSQIVSVLPSLENYNPNCCSDNSTYTPEYEEDYIVLPTTNPTIWESPMKIKGTITIETGAVLTLQGSSGEFQFGPNGKIIVEKGAKLTINNATLTGLKLCKTMWQGIEVHGTGRSLNTANNGLLILNNAKIFDAHNAVTLGKPTFIPSNNAGFVYNAHDANFGGGIIQANGSTFARNAVDIRFWEYSFINNHIINNCVFGSDIALNDKYYSTTENPSYNYNTYVMQKQHPHYAPANQTGRSSFGIYTFGNRNLIIDNCRFNNIEFAINAANTKLTFRNENFFNNHYAGIYIKNTIPSVDYRSNIINSTFSNVSDYAIYIESGRNDVIKNNFFNTIATQPQSMFKNGIYLKSSSGFDIRDNNLSSILKGITVINSNTGGGLLGYDTKGNNFNACHQAIYTTSTNPKLTVRCNIFSPNQQIGYLKNWMINGPSFANQGIYNTSDHRSPAGNDFYDPNNKHIASNIPFKYVHHTQEQTKPALNGTWTNNGANIINNNTAKIYSGASASCAELTVIPNMTEYNQIENNLFSLKAEYNNIANNLDRNNTSGLIAAINGNTSAGNLKNLLIAHSPLSDEVLINYINSSKSSSPGLFKDVLTHNLPVSDEVYEIFEAKLNLLPAGIATQLRKLQGINPDYRTTTAVKSDIADISMQKQLYTNKFVNYLFNNNQNLQAINLLENENSIESNKTLLSYYISENNLVKAIEKVNILSNSESADYIDYNNLLISKFGDSLDVFDLDSAEVEYIRNLAYSNNISQEVSNARAVLWLLFGENFDNSEDNDNNNKSLSLNNLQVEKHRLTNELLIGNNPNPVSSKTTVWYQLPSDNENTLLIIFDATGKKVKEYKLNNEENSILVDVLDLQNGLYTYSLSINNTIFESRKMIVIK